MKTKKYKPLYPTAELGWSRVDEIIENADKNLQYLIDIDTKQKADGKVLYRYFSLPCCDSTVYYQITKIDEELCKVEWCKGICLDEYEDNVLGKEAFIMLAKAEELIYQKDCWEAVMNVAEDKKIGYK